ncbi:glutathione S-transferase family protein [Microbulbifer hainanensis]|uniref:glutathione S-transferase family protein n=1 Tax=Microbulbifer hainanensis TaxID=2735675 RepID=UPI001866A4D4|nr:glutathione S-transferase family protein [Microbulbifer hainanensis]
MSRIFYSGTRNASSWAFRAWLALREQNIDFEEIVVDIRRPQRFDNLRRIGEFSPPSAVPVLVDDDMVIFDSSAIMEYASEIGDGSLLPENVQERARCRSFLSWQHSGLSGICPKLSFERAFYPDKRPMTQEEVADAARIFGAWEMELGRSGGPFLHGVLSLSDLAFVPTILRICSHKPDMEKWPLTAAWIDRLLSRDSVKEWLDEAEKLPPIILEDGYLD